MAPEATLAEKKSLTDDTFRVSRPYCGKYVEHAGRGTSERKPWSLSREIIARSGPGKDFLDLGCGDSRKTATMAAYFRSFTGLDPSEAMLEASRANFLDIGAKNAVAVRGCGEALPFPNDSFDVVSCFLAGFHFPEIHRVLRPGGHFIIEGIGARDHTELKGAFPPDVMGYRGQYLECDEEEFRCFLTSQASNIFESVTYQIGFWKTWLPFSALIALLETTPIIRNFDAAKDASTVAILRSRVTERGFETVENRILMTGRKPLEIHIKANGAARHAKIHQVNP